MKNQTNRDPAEIMRDEMVMRERILCQLQEEPSTIPEIAEALDYPANDVTIWIMAMWRYGIIEEVGKPNDDGFYKYRPAK